MTAKELIEHLNLSDECNFIEAKKGSAIDRSIMETICAFSNEPGLDGGYILIGAELEKHSLFPSYVVCGVEHPDKLQLDLSTQCATMFNQPIRPDIKVEHIGGKNVIVVYVPEIAEGLKPTYFKNEGLPRGAYRRIGSSDQRCTDDDLIIFYNKEDSLDNSVVSESSVDDISEEATMLYRRLREKVNAYAEELQYNDLDLLHSLGCIKKVKGATFLTYAGLLLFGKKTSHRRLLPMVRVDYIRVPGNEWVEDPDTRFTTIDMRGALLEMVQRIFSLITDDLPKGFLLPEGELQAESIGLPARVLREAIVNALIHRSYRVNQPIQVIRYGNRIEITNPGFSLKPEDHLGEPGSKNRNPYIAAVFHETNLAETKGSGIRIMRSLMEKANLMPPTFESDHTRNQFTVRLLLHHFLGAEDIDWLANYSLYDMNENQKRALIFIKEVGAIDNSSYRQLNGVDTLKASADLRDLRRKNILSQKGKGKATYYVGGPNLVVTTNDTPDTTPDAFNTPHGVLNTPHGVLNTPPDALKTPPDTFNTPPDVLNTPPFDEVPDALFVKIKELKRRINEPQRVKELIVEICKIRAWKASEIATIFSKEEDYFKRRYLSEMIAQRELVYLFPEMINHPEQAYLTPQNENK
jgi:ATP-dependent DNA helicase RecG